MLPKIHLIHSHAYSLRNGHRRRHRSGLDVPGATPAVQIGFLAGYQWRRRILGRLVAGSGRDAERGAVWTDGWQTRAEKIADLAGDPVSPLLGDHRNCIQTVADQCGQVPNRHRRRSGLRSRADLHLRDCGDLDTRYARRCVPAVPHDWDSPGLRLGIRDELYSLRPRLRSCSDWLPGYLRVDAGVARLANSTCN